MPIVRSSADLRNSYNSISILCHESREPVFITKNGQGDLAVMSVEVYEEFTRKRARSLEESKEELCRLLAEGRADAEAGRTRPIADVTADVKRKIDDGSI